VRLAESAGEIIGGAFDYEHILIFVRDRFRKYTVTEDASELKLKEDHPFLLPVKDCKFIEVLKGEK